VEESLDVPIATPDAEDVNGVAIVDIRLRQLTQKTFCITAERGPGIVQTERFEGLEIFSCEPTVFDRVNQI